MNAIEKHKGKFVIIPTGEHHGVYELMRTLNQIAPPEKGEIEKCPCCNQPMLAVFDVMQSGFWEDEYWVYFACLPCKKAECFNYSISRIEVKKRSSKQKER